MENIFILFFFFIDSLKRMPIPKDDQKEFFIQDINKFVIQTDYNQAVIYQPAEEPHFNSNNYSFTRRSVRHHFFEILSSVFLNEDIERFVSNMKRIYLEVQNENNPNHDTFFYFDLQIRSHMFASLLFDFISTRNNYDIISLTYDFYLNLPDDHNIQNFLGTELATRFRNKILAFHDHLLGEKEKKEKRKLKKQLYKQFKEFKVHQHYLGRKSNIMLTKTSWRKCFTNQNKYRKLKHLRKAIISFK